MSKVTIEWLKKKIEAIEETERFYGFIGVDMQTHLEAYRELLEYRWRELEEIKVTVDVWPRG